MKTLNYSVFCVLIPLANKSRHRKSTGKISLTVFESGSGWVMNLLCISFQLNYLQQSTSTIQQKVFVFTKQKEMFQRCRQMIDGALRMVILYNFFAFILIILNLLGSWLRLSTPVKVLLTLSAFDNISFTKIQSFSTYLSPICLDCKLTKGSPTPEHPVPFLCLFKQTIPQLLTLHLGHVYLYSAFSQTVHNSFLCACLATINSDDSSFQLISSPSQSSQCSELLINNQYNRANNYIPTHYITISLKPPSLHSLFAYIPTCEIIGRQNEQFEFINLTQMKVYLSDHNPYPRDCSSNKSDHQRNKNRSQKNPTKNKTSVEKALPESQFSSKHLHPQSMITNRSKSCKRQETSHPISVKLYKQHLRTHTDSEMPPKHEDSKPQNLLNKTFSKNRLKTEGSHYNGQTIKVIKKQAKHVEMESNFVTNIVKDRLNQEKKRGKCHENDAIKRIINLAQMAKQNKHKNPEEDSDSSKRNHKQLENTFEALYSEMQKEDLSMREEALCEVIRTVMKKMRHLQSSDQSQRLLRVVRQLQQRNVRMMTLINCMKRKGVNVEEYWNSSTLS